MRQMLLANKVEVTFGHSIDVEAVECKSVIEKRTEARVQIDEGHKQVDTIEILEDVEENFVGQLLELHPDD